MSSVQVLLLPIGGNHYALPMEWAREVAAAPAVTGLVTAPAVVMGLFNLRGQIVPLLDTARLLGTGRVEQAAYAVVVTCPLGLVGLATTGLPERQALEESVASSDLAGTTGLYRVDHRVAALLDPTTLLSAEQLRGRGVGVDAVDVGGR